MTQLAHYPVCHLGGDSRIVQTMIYPGDLLDLGMQNVKTWYMNPVYCCKLPVWLNDWAWDPFQAKCGKHDEDDSWHRVHRWPIPTAVDTAELLHASLEVTAHENAFRIFDIFVLDRLVSA